jgi:hypothetical protein
MDDSIAYQTVVTLNVSRISGKEDKETRGYPVTIKQRANYKRFYYQKDI